MADKGFVFRPRIIRSPFADCWGKELETSLAAYTDDYLREIAAEGYDAIWVHVILRETVATKLFPGVKRDRVGLLNRIVARAARFGIKVYVYLLEPRAPRAGDPFWVTHAGLKGQPVTFSGISAEFDDTYYALCTSTPEVKEYLVEGPRNLFREVPGLGGAFLINASEGHTHCYSHFPKWQKQFADPYMTEWAKGEFFCPRCAPRDPSAVTAEVISLIRQGIKSASPSADVICWTWSWVILEADPQPRLIGMLPKDVILMSDWERGGSKKVLGKTYEVDEYSHSSIGPSIRFQRQLRLAKKRGMRMMAKIQIGCTHELAAVPYVPLPHILGEKLRRMKEIGVDGYLGCWIFGGDISPMSKVAGQMSRRPAPTIAQAVRTVAREEFGSHAPAVGNAWKHFAKAWREYPFSIPVVYNGPMNYATAFPFDTESLKNPQATNWLKLPRDRRGRLILGYNIHLWISPFGRRIVEQAFRRLLREWRPGVALLERALRSDPDNVRLQQEFGLARHIELCLGSTVNVLVFEAALKKYQCLPASRRGKFRTILGRILNEETETARLDKQLVQADPRLGYHSEAHSHHLVPGDFDYKMVRIRVMLRRISKP